MDGTNHRGAALRRLTVLLGIAGWMSVTPTAWGSGIQDLNQATRAEIEAVRGVGVELADRLLKARELRPFADWVDLRQRVKGVSRSALAGFKEAGFRIGHRPPDDQK